MLKINFLGDSITEGAMASSQENTFVRLVGAMLHCKVNNYGISGSRIAKQKIPSIEPRYDLYFASRVAAMDADADFVFVFGGTNDYGHGDALMGKIDDKTPDTFYGAMNNLIDELEKKYKKNRIFFILPLYRIDESNPYGEGSKAQPGCTLAEYRKAMTEVLKKRHIEIFDIKDIIGKAENNPLIYDGLHPNDEGHKKIAELVVNFIKRKMRDVE